MNRVLVTAVLVAGMLTAACGDSRPSPTAPPATVAAMPAADVSLISSGGVTTGMTNPNKGDASRNLAIATPADVVEGDFLLAQVTWEKGSDAAVTAPDGWTLVRRTDRLSDIGQAIYYRFAPASVPSSQTWGFSQAVKAAGGILRYTGVDPTSPIADSSGNSGDSGTLTANSVVATTNSRLIALFGFKKKDTTLSVPSGMSGRYNFQNPQDVTIRAADQMVGAGATGHRTSTPSPKNSDKWVAHLVALNAAATVTVNKVVLPNVDAGKFDLRINGTTYTNDAGHGGTTGTIVIPAGSVTVSEQAGTATDLGDYISKVVCDTGKGSADPGDSHTFNLTPGENVVCTFTNTRKATLTVTKALVPSSDAGRFNLRIDGTNYAEEVGDAGTTGTVTLAPGAYTVSETAVAPAVLSNYTTVIGGACAANGAITLTPGQNATCTITNTRKATLTVTKTLSPSSDPGRFNLLISGTSYAMEVGDGGTTNGIGLVPGTYTVSETAVAPAVLSDYTAVIGGACAANGAITLAPGQVATCTISNTRNAPPPPPAPLFYLHNNPSPPTGNTATQTNLPLNETAPTGSTLYNYATTYDSNSGVTGRYMDKTASGVNETDGQKQQSWVTATLASDLVVNASVQLRIWAKNKDAGKTQTLTAFVRNCNAALSTCTTIGTLTMSTVSNASNTFVERTLSGTVNGTVSSGNRLLVKVVNVDTGDPVALYLAYDTTTYLARLIFP